jgi:anaerobic magnesium-protoporphyrin IX monomethyl ester cyclase
MSNDPSVLLVVPPGSYADMPTLAIACLQAYLKSRGITNIYAWDANLDYLSFLTDPEQLRIQEERIRSGAAPAGSEESRERILFSLPFLQKSIGDAEKIFHDPVRYYDIPSFNRAVALVQSALEAYNTEADPIEHLFNSAGFYTKIDRARLPFSIAPILKFAKNPESWWWFRTFFSTALSKIQMDRPFDLVGLTCPNPQQFLPALMMARLFKESGVARETVLGGSFVSSQRKKICEAHATYDFFDYVITFEGEEALLKLVEARMSGREPSDVPGIHFRRGEEVVKVAPKTITDLSALPTPDFSGLPLTRYWTPEPVLPAFSTRGCYFDVCSFCNHHENYFGKFRMRSTDRVIDDLRTFEKMYGATKIFFVDELLVPKQHVEIARRIAQEELRTRWYCHARVEKQFTKENLEILAKGGVALLHVGMESANTRVLKLMKKGYDRERVVRFLEDISQLPITLHLNTIWGYPGEQPDEYLETLETAWEFVKSGDYVHLYPFGFLDGAPISQDPGPFVTDVKTNEADDLDGALSFVRVGSRLPSDDEERKITRLRTALGTLTVLNGLFPEHCCWAAHLLYVCHYRDSGQSECIDRPLKEMPSQSDLIRSFSGDESMLHWSVHPSASNVSFRTKEERRSFPVCCVLNLDTFEHLRISESAARLLQVRHGNYSPLDFPDRAELYRMVKAGIVKLHRGKGGDSNEELG